MKFKKLKKRKTQKLLDHFAGVALLGLMNDSPPGDSEVADYAFWAYETALAMIRERDEVRSKRGAWKWRKLV